MVSTSSSFDGCASVDKESFSSSKKWFEEFASILSSVGIEGRVGSG